MTPADSAHARKVTTWLAAAVLLAAIGQAAFVTHGSMTRWHTFTDYYDQLAEAFHHGQTHLLVQPLPQLLQLSDPYDPASNAPWRLHDAELYQGRYYLYWGPAPALLLSAIKLVVDVPLGDQWLAWFAMVGMVGAGALILREIADDTVPPWLLLVGVLALGLSSPVAVLLTRAAIYETAIACGQLLLFLGLWLALLALRRDSLPRLTPPLLVGLATLCWTCAFASRLSLLPAVMLLCILLLVAIRARQPAGGVGTAWLVALFGPVLAGLAGLGLYNQVRFGAVGEFGLQYQLTGEKLHVAALTASFQPQYVASNALAYLLGPVDLTLSYPWLSAAGARGPAEPVAGLVFTLPFVLAGLWLITRRADICRRTCWLIGSLVGTTVLAAAPVLLAVGGAQNRYMVDVVPALLLLAIIGCQHSWRVHETHRRYLAIGILGLSLWSVAAGISLAGFWSQYTAPLRQTSFEWYPPDPAPAPRNPGE